MHAFCSFPEKEEMEDGVGDLFDHIEDLLDFPGDDDVVGMVESCGDDESGPLMIPPLPESIANELLDGRGEDLLEGFIDQNQKSVDEKISTDEDKQSPCDELDIVQLEWMSKFLEESDSFSLGLPSGSDAVGKSVNSHGPKVDELCFFLTSSPVSVLEAISNAASSNSSSSFSSSTSTLESYFIGSAKEARAPPLSPSPPEQPTAPIVPGRARSKRARPAVFSLRPHVIPCNLAPYSVAVPVPDQVSSCAATSDPESFGESFPALPPLKKKQKKKIPASNGYRTDSPPSVRKCTHCEIQKTPQWRAGPLGPKTLCNACGVRYKSGRLFPEYRPAASPTFVPSIHSNSHKKVIEMRVTATQMADSCDLLAYIRRRE